MIITLILLGRKILRSKVLIENGLQIAYPTLFEEKIDSNAKLVDSSIKEMKESYNTFVNILKDSFDTQKKQINILNNQNEECKKLIIEIRENFSIFGENISVLEKELEYHKKGNDAKKLNGLIKKIIKLRNIISKESLSNTHSEELQVFINDFVELIDDTIQDYNIEIVYPKIGSKYSDYDFISENPEMIKTLNIKEDLEIINVSSPAFMIEVNKERKTLVNANVTIKRFDGE